MHLIQNTYVNSNTHIFKAWVFFLKINSNNQRTLSWFDVVIHFCFSKEVEKNPNKSWLCKKNPLPLSFLLSGESWFAKKQRSPSPHLFMLVKLALEIEAVLLWILWQYLCCHFFKLWFGHVLASQNRPGGTYGTVGSYLSPPSFGNYLIPNSAGGGGQIMPTI